jgi:hypothetical protein
MSLFELVPTTCMDPKLYLEWIFIYYLVAPDAHPCNQNIIINCPEDDLLHAH